MSAQGWLHTYACVGISASQKGCKGLAYLYIKDFKEAPRPRKQTALLSCLSSMLLLLSRRGPLMFIPLNAKPDCPFPFLYYQFIQPFYKLKSYTRPPSSNCPGFVFWLYWCACRGSGTSNRLGCSASLSPKM